MFKSALILTILLFEITSLNFNLMGNKQFCMRFQGGNSYGLQYVVSGNEDQNVKCVIKQNQNIILTKQGVSQFQYITDYKDQSKFIFLLSSILFLAPISICFTSTDNTQKQISFDFYQSTDPLRQIIDKKDVTIVQQSLIQTYKKMQQISRNQQFQIQRDQQHKLNLEQSETKIKWAGVVKIVFLLGSALIQLWIMKGFFTNTNPYQPVEMM